MEAKTFLYKSIEILQLPIFNNVKILYNRE